MCSGSWWVWRGDGVPRCGAVPPCRRQGGRRAVVTLGWPVAVALGGVGEADQASTLRGEPNEPPLTRPLHPLPSATWAAAPCPPPAPHTAVCRRAGSRLATAHRALCCRRFPPSYVHTPASFCPTPSFFCFFFVFFSRPPPAQRRSTPSRTPARRPASPACRRPTFGGRDRRGRPTRARFGGGSGSSGRSQRTMFEGMFGGVGGRVLCAGEGPTMLDGRSRGGAGGRGGCGAGKLGAKGRPGEMVSQGRRPGRDSTRGWGWRLGCKRWGAEWFLRRAVSL